MVDKVFSYPSHSTPLKPPGVAARDGGIASPEPPPPEFWGEGCDNPSLAQAPPAPGLCTRRLGFSPGVSSLEPPVCTGSCQRFLLPAPRHGSGG